MLLHCDRPVHWPASAPPEPESLLIPELLAPLDPPLLIPELPAPFDPPLPIPELLVPFLPLSADVLPSPVGPVDSTNASPPHGMAKLAAIAAPPHRPRPIEPSYAHPLKQQRRVAGRAVARGERENQTLSNRGRALREYQHPCGHDGGVPICGTAKPGGPQPPVIPGKLTGDLKTGLPLAIWYPQHVICGSSDTGFLSLAAPALPDEFIPVPT